MENICNSLSMEIANDGRQTMRWGFVDFYSLVWQVRYNRVEMDISAFHVSDFLFGFRIFDTGDVMVVAWAKN